MTVYEVHTDLPPDKLNEVGREIFTMWSEFALGLRELGGKMIHHPTGRYASSLRYLHFKESVVTIMADTKIAPEAAFIESGHRPINLLEKLTAGRTYPMHRGTQFSYVGGGAKGKRMWAEARASGFNGFATTPADGIPIHGENSSGTGPAWTIPAMPAYSPALILAELLQAAYGRAQVRH